jgi:hypothetical protein
VNSWSASQNLGSDMPGTRTKVIRKVASARSIAGGSSLQIKGISDQSDFARVDYIEFIPAMPSGNG